ncbi:hypothetical protein PV04_05397 [Phialophora macrospora]|uniref:DUF218 domain-containing protein n=1 Tax=Phialophora macrospora TaxID=1851006 RepID=A0A0D2GBW3_9EURO|nr:hypothetical protein PV04_05397 [Phialophora macrospora]
MSPSTSAPVPVNHLIIVCCHAIYLGGEGGCANEANWLIEPFQAGETETYIRHVEAGVAGLARDPDNAILVFSGGATKRDKTARSEGEGYLAVALERNLFNLDAPAAPSALRPRLFVDRYATDSYQNVLLPLVQFPLYVQELQTRLRGRDTAPDSTATVEEPKAKLSHPTWPIKVTIISHGFKRRRFLDLHVPAMRLLLSRVAYVGIDPPFEPARMAQIEEGDRLRGYGAWERDPYGLGEGLRGKREKRGWDEESFRAEVLERFAGEARTLVERVVAFKGRDDDGRAPWEE